MAHNNNSTQPSELLKLLAEHRESLRAFFEQTTPISITHEVAPDVHGVVSVSTKVGLVAGKLQSNTTVIQNQKEQPSLTVNSETASGSTYVTISQGEDASKNSTLLPEKKPEQLVSKTSKHEDVTSELPIKEKKQDSHVTKEFDCSWNKKVIINIENTPGKPNKIETKTLSNPGGSEPNRFVLITWDGRKNKIPLIPRTYDLNEHNFMNDWVGEARKEIESKAATAASSPTSSEYTSSHSPTMFGMSLEQKNPKAATKSITLLTKTDLETILGKDFSIKKIEKGEESLYEAIIIEFNRDVNVERLQTTLNETLLIGLPAHIKLTISSYFPPKLVIPNNPEHCALFSKNIETALASKRSHSLTT